MSIEKVRKYMEKFDMQKRILEFDTSSATVELAAEAVGCTPAQIAKSMTFMAGERHIMIVTSGDTKIDNHKYKEHFLTKAKMMMPQEVDEYIGHSIGGVCPFGINDGVEVYLDESMKRFEYVYPAAGSSNSAVKITPDELYKLSNAKDWGDYCKEII